MPVLPRAYPVRPEGDEDSRFTRGLALDVKAVLEEHGYPPITSGRDLLELELALFGFIYGTAKEGGIHG